MRGETCVAIATFCSFVSVLLLIFANVGQINTSSVPRKLHMVQVNVSSYITALEAATGVAAPGLYLTNATAPLEQGDGLRHIYSWGLYGYCGYINANLTGGLCSNKTTALQFQPMNVLLGDVSETYNIQTRTLVPQATAFKNSGYLGGLTRPAFWFLFMATIAAGVALIAGIIKNKYTFLVASFCSIVSSLFLLIGASIWTAAIAKAQTVNRVVVRGGVPLGIEVSAGSSLYLFWAAFIFITLSTLPYSISTWAFIKR